MFLENLRITNLYIKYFLLNVQIFSEERSQTEPVWRTVAARKYFDEPLDISIQRKVSEQVEDDKWAASENVKRYHPYPRQEVQDRPINLEVPKKPWYPAPSRSQGLKEQLEPVDFSKKKQPETLQQKRQKRQCLFQRNLLVILLQNISKDPAFGKQIVRYLKFSCEKVQSRGCSGGQQGYSHQSGSGSGSSSGFSGGNNIGGGNSGTGGSLNSSRSNSTDQDDSNNLFDVSETDLDNIDFDFNESSTRKWIADNPDLSPLKVLDHISFKPEPPSESPGQDLSKPPDLETLDRDTANILQLAVPVPDPSSTFLDIGTDFGPVSFYEDDPFNLEQLVPSTFNLINNSNGMNQQHNGGQHQPLYPIHHQNNNTGSHHPLQGHGSHVILQHHDDVKQHQIPSAKLTTSLEPSTQINVNFSSMLPDSSVHPSLTQPLIRHNVENQNNVKYSVKSEPQPAPSTPHQQTFYPQIKEENHMGYQTGYSSPSDSPPMGNGGGKMRVAPQRKKSTSSSNDEEDLMNVPSLQMRIQILQQRVSCKKKFKNDLHLKKIICTKKQKLSYLSIDFYEIRKYFVKPLFPFLNVNLFSDSHKQFYSTKIFYQRLKCSCKYFYDDKIFAFWPCSITM